MKLDMSCTLYSFTDHPLSRKVEQSESHILL